MSSWICSPKHFNSLQRRLTDMFYSVENIPYPMRIAYPDLHNRPPEETKKFIDDIAKLNALCVTLQYAHHYPDVKKEYSEQADIVLKRGKQYAPIPDLPSLYKALCCLRYQIEIDKLERVRPLTEAESNAWKSLQALIEMVADKFISSTDAYDKAPWGIK